MYGEDGSAEARAQVSEQDAILALLTLGTRRWEDRAKRVRARRGPCCARTAQEFCQRSSRRVALRPRGRPLHDEDAANCQGKYRPNLRNVLTGGARPNSTTREAMGVAVLRCLEIQLRLDAFSFPTNPLRTGTNPVEPKYKRMNPKSVHSAASVASTVSTSNTTCGALECAIAVMKTPQAKEGLLHREYCVFGPSIRLKLVWHDPSPVQPGAWLSLSRFLDPSPPPGQLMPPAPSSSCVSGDGERGKVGERTVESACSAADVSSWSCEK